jgi:hypothetical protein
MGAWLKPNLGRRDQRSDSFAAPGTAPVFDAFCGCQPPSGPIVFSLNTEVHFPPLQSRWFFYGRTAHHPLLHQLLHTGKVAEMAGLAVLAGSQQAQGKHGKECRILHPWIVD